MKLVLLVVLLTGCATVQRYDYTYVTCDGRTRTTEVEERIVAAPPLDCAAEAGRQGYHDLALWWLLATPLACVVWDRSRRFAIVILPYAFTDAAREHELRHVRGDEHPVLLPVFAQSC